MNRKILNSVFKIIIFIIVAYGAYCVVIAAYYSAPNAEDFALSIAPREVGSIQSVIDLLSYFDSRYTSNVLHAFNLLVFNQYKLYFLMPLITLIFFGCSILYFVKSIGLVKNSLLIAAFILTIILSITPSLSFAIYYMSSSFTYTYPIIFWFLWVGSVFNLFNSKGISYFLYLTLGLISLFLSFGCSELFLVINFSTLIYLLFFAFKKSYFKFLELLPFIAIAIASILFIFNLPSQKFSFQNEFYDIPISEIILKWIYNNYILLKSLIFNPIFITSACVLYFLNLENKLIKNNILFIVFMFIVGLGTSLLFFIGLQSTDEYPLRIFNITFIILFFTLVLIIQKVFKRIEFIAKIIQIRVLLSIVLILSLLYFPNNFKNIITEYRNGVYKDFKEDMETFYKDVEDVKKFNVKSKIVYINFKNDYPSSNLAPQDLVPNREEYFWNLAYEEYFNVDEVRLKNDTVFKFSNYEN